MNGEFRALSLGTLAVILLALGAWAAFFGPDDDDGGPEGPIGDDATAESQVDGPLVRQSLPFSDSWDGASIDGVVVLQGGCLLLDTKSSDGLALMPIVWPATTEWDADASEIVLPSGERLGIGDQVGGGGNYPDLERIDRLELLGEEARAKLHSCPGDGEVANFNNAAEQVRPG